MRPITALFADIVGSTGLGERLGPDEVKALVGEFVTRMSRAVEEFGGVVQAYMGDGICAYFGVPAAHEDDPERAARAALRILGIAAGYASEVEAAWGIAGFGVRVGLNSGPAAVGLVGASDEQTVALGDTTNVAARLQSAAEPGTVVVGPESASRLSMLFVLEPIGAVKVKGRREAVQSWRLVGPRPVGAARHSTAFVGRDRELGALDASVADLRSGRGQVLLVVGEAGLGKTRMLEELRVRVGEEAAWLEGRCASYGAEAPYGPFVDVLRSWIGAEEGDAELAVRTKLRARAGGLLEDRAGELLPYLGLLLAVRLDPDRERDLLSLSADELAERQRDAYLAWAEALAATRPLVLAIDDLHWANATTRELAERLLSLTDRSAVLLALTTRPDPRSQGWALRVTALGDYAHRAEDLVLAPLTADAARELVDALAPFGLLPEAMRAEIVGRAEGNPLYAEELVRVLLETGGDRRRTWSLAPAAAANLPPALEALLVARIDGLEPGPRRMAQVAAVVGREFPASVATEVAGGGEDDLAALLRAGVVREIRRFPELECTFRHGLLQEAALATLTPETQRELYGRVGEAMERRLGEQAGEDVEQLAFYFYRSDDHTKALDYLLRAAERARELEADERARELLSRAEKLATRIGDDAATSRAQSGLRELDARQAGSA
jgi:predicted ATPase/class 3 adenylate cyclase